MPTMPLETRWDPIHGYDYTYWPDSKYFRNYRFSPPISFAEPWSYRSRVWFPYYWSTRRLFQHYMDYQPSGASIRDVRRMVCTTYPIKGIDYPYYPESTKHYRPLTLYYNYYWPIRSLSYYSDVWPYYPYYRYLYYKYTLPSDRYYHLKGRMIYLRDPIYGNTEYRVYPTASYLRHKVYTPLSLYCDYYEPIRSLFWNTSYWPLYRSVASFENDLPSRGGTKLQRIFDDETRLIRAQTASLLRRIHDPVPRVNRYSWPLSTVTRYDDSLPARFSNDNYIQRTLVTAPGSRKVQYTTYYTEPVRKYIGAGHLASVSYAGEYAYSRRRPVYIYDDPVKSDIQLLSYYIQKFRHEKAIAAPEPAKVPLNPARPTRRFAANQADDEKQAKELKELREARAARQAFIQQDERDKARASRDVDDAVKAKKAEEDARLAAEKAAAAEEQARQEAQAKKEEAARREAEERKAEAARKAELARQEELAAQAAAERAAELERQAELTRQREAELQAEIERKKKEEEERARLEEQKRLEDEARAEEERKQLERLEELARQAEEDKEAELKRQADELAELARQEAELAEQAKQEAEAEELARQQTDLEELERQQKELEELEKQEKELQEQANQEAEVAAKAQEDAEAARLAAEQEELEELERQQAELDRLEAEAKVLEADATVAEEPEPAEEEPTAPAEDEEEKYRELDELMRQKQELAELERAQAELDALEAEAKALACDFGDSPGKDAPFDDEDDRAIAEDIPGELSDAAEDE